MRHSNSNEDMIEALRVSFGSIRRGNPNISFRKGFIELPYLFQDSKQECIQRDLLSSDFISQIIDHNLALRNEFWFGVYDSRISWTRIRSLQSSHG
jgi:hypothetical protein